MTIKRSAILSFFFLFSFTFLTAQNIYVAKNGVDDTTDPTRGSIQKPFKTIDFAAKEKAAAGDTIFVRKGTYYNEKFGENKTKIYSNETTVTINELHGKRDKYIVIMPYNKERVVFKGDGSIIFQIRNSSYVKIQDFIIVGEVKNISLEHARAYQFKYLDTLGVEHSRIGDEILTDAQIGALELDEITQNIVRPTYFNTKGLLVQSSRHITVENNTISYMPGTGLRFQGCDYFKCIGNTVHNSSRRSAVGTHGLVVHTLTSKGTSNATRVFIERNTVHNNYNELYSWSPYKTFIKTEIDEGKGISMQKNTAAKGWKHGKVVIRNNITYRNGLSGVHINQGERMDIINNVSFKNHHYGHNNNIGISVSSGKDIKVQNNISVADDSWGGNAFAIDNSTNVKAANNLYVGKVNTAFAALDKKLIAVTDEPLFVAASSRNFALASGSPAINSGLKGATPLDDFFGNDRDDTPDRGAINYASSNETERKASTTATPLFKKIERKTQRKNNNNNKVPEIKRTNYLQLNQNTRSKSIQLAANQQFNLFDDVQINVQLEKSSRKYYKNLEVYTGRTEDARFAHLPQYRDAVVVFNPNTNKITAVIDNDQGSFQISPILGSETYQVTEYWDSAVDCQKLPTPTTDRNNSSTARARMMDCEDVDADGDYVIDLFVGYSNTAAVSIGDIDAHAQSLVTMVNNGLTNSLVTNVYLRLVGTGTNPENPGIVQSVLKDVYGWYNREIQETGADFIASIQRPTGAAGEQGGFGGIGEYSSVNSIYSSVNVFRHEMGHNVGGGHCVGDASKFPYAHGHSNGNVSTHLCGNGTNFYSNPAILDAQGVAMGDAATADMARVWTERAEEMANRNSHRVAIGNNDDCMEYCLPFHLGSNNELINKVVLNTIDHTSAGGTSNTVDGYSDFSAISTTVQIGTDYDLTVTPNYSFASSRLSVWADWNRDLVFETAELIETHTGTGPWTTTVTPPANATAGNVRLRIRLQYGSSLTPDPCNNSNYGNGETEDYTLTVLPAACTAVELNTTDFERGYGIWNDGGIDCRKNRNDAEYASNGEFCIRLRNTGAEAVMNSDVLDLSAYENITVDFGYYVRSFEKVEGFGLQLSTDGGTTFQAVKEWNLGTDFNNDEFKTAQVIIEEVFTNATVLRFYCAASGKSDWVYLDDVKITGCTQAASANSLIVNNTVNNRVETPIATINTTNKNQVATTSLTVFPNPFSDNLTIQTDAKEWFVFSAFGQLIQQGTGENTTINLGDLPAGIYFIKADKETNKVIKR